MKMEVSVKQFGHKIKSLILKPAAFWKNEKLQPNGTHQMFLGHFLPLVILAGAAEFIGVLNKVPGFYLVHPFMYFIREILLYVLLYFCSVFITNQLIKPFGGHMNLTAVRKLVTYSLMPLILVSIVTNLFPFLYVLDMLSFYSFFIFIAGVEEMLDLPDNKRIRYVLMTLMANLFIFSFLTLFLSKLVASFL